MSAKLELQHRASYAENRALHLATDLGLLRDAALSAIQFIASMKKSPARDAAIMAFSGDLYLREHCDYYTTATTSERERWAP